MSTQTAVQTQANAKPAVTPVAGGMLQRACACGQHASSGGGECEECRKKRQGLLQRSATNMAPVGEVPPIVHDVLRSPGRPLDATTRAFMEPRFDHDFSGVRVHTDLKAAESAKAVNALAYTVGRDVVFANGQYMPNSNAGRQLIAHELTHVVQQNRQSIAPQLTISESTRESELEANKLATQVTQDKSVTTKIHHLSGSNLARQEAPARRPAQESAQPGPSILQEIPVIFVAEPLAPTLDSEPGGVSISPTGPMVSGGLSLHVLSSGDLSWLSSRSAAQRVLSSEYWSPLLPSRGRIPLDRLLDELPRDLAPRIEGELASGQPLSWVRGAGQTGTAFTEAELRDFPNLVRRFNAGETLSQTEISLLARAAEIHVGGSTPGAPFASYTRPNFELPFRADARYRVRVEIPRSNVLDVSQPNGITRQWSQTPNVEEMEFMAAANHEGRIVSVQRMRGGARPSLLMRYSGAIRWGGRILLVAGVAMSVYRVATAPEGERLNVAAEEGGGLAGGAAGTALAVAGCVAFGVATGGIGLFLCGLAGGVLGGVVGSAAGGGMMRGLQASGAGTSTGPGGTPCPSCHALQREWEARRAFRSLSGAQLGNSGSLMDERLSREGRAPGTRALTPQELELIRQWLQRTDRQPAR